MGGRGSRYVGGALLCAVLVATTAGPATGTAPDGDATEDLRQPQTSEDGVDVSTYGARWVPVMNNALEGRTLQAVHAVQRVGDRTVVYWSIGSEDEAGVYPRAAAVTPPATTSWRRRTRPRTSTSPCPAGARCCTPAGARRPGIAAAASGLDALPSEPGVMGVQFAVLPGCPPT